MRTTCALALTAAAVTCACGGTMDLTGDTDAAGDTAPDTAIDTAVDATTDTPVDTTTDPWPDGECCPAGMVLDRGRGICVETPEIGADCEGLPDACGFGQRCEPRFGYAYMGSFCQIHCDAENDYVCPDGWVCQPAQCCDIPDMGCVPDACTPPLLMHPGTFACASPQGLHMDCSTLESCSEGQDCVRYMGVDGLERQSCEISCAGNPRLCPNGYICTDWDDGPSNVCEPFATVRECEDPMALTCGQPDKFVGGFTDGFSRDFVCAGCYGSVFCVDDTPEAIGALQSLAPTGAIECHAPYPSSFCGDGRIPCLLDFRSGADDCPGMMPSDFHWSVVCAAAALDVVRSVHCYWLE